MRLLDTLIAANPARRTVFVSVALAAGLAALVLLPALGHKPLSEWDEGIYAEVSREMVGGSWLVPHWNYQPWFEKPPLMLWITAIFFKFFGVSEFWARAGSAFAGIAIVALLHGWLARRRELLTAWIGTVILLATFGFLHVCHVGEMDVLLSLGASIALIGLCSVAENNPHGWFLFWTGFAIALMTKSAASVVIPVTALLFGGLERWNWRRFGLSFLLGLALFLVLVLPWHVAMYLRFGRDFVAQYLGLHVLTRATHQIEGHSTHWWYYVVVLLVSAPPFCLLYPVVIRDGLRRSELRVLAVFTLVVVGFFTVIQTRLPHYIAPAYPALAVLTAVWIGDWLRPRLLIQPKLYWLRAGLATAALWSLSILLTHSTLKSLHSADLAGPGRLDNREADTLLKSTILPDLPGPLLYLRDGRVQSIATVVFYSRRQVQQVALTPPAPATPLDSYRFNPQLLDQAVGSGPRLILLDKSLIPSIPPQFRYKSIRASATVELGVIARTP